MGTRQPREYQTHPQGPTQTPCACGWRTGWAPVNAPYGASQRPRPHDAAKPHQPAHGPTRRFSDSLPYEAANQLLARCLRCLSWPTSAPMPAHNAGAAVSRIVPVIHDRPFHFDPRVIVHDAENLLH
jgi:hypothetical protein